MQYRYLCLVTNSNKLGYFSDLPFRKFLQWCDEISRSMICRHCPDQHSNNRDNDTKEAEHEEVMQFIGFDQKKRNEEGHIYDCSHEICSGDISTAYGLSLFVS